MNNIPKILIELRKHVDSKGNLLLDELIKAVVDELDQVSKTLKR